MIKTLRSLAQELGPTNAACYIASRILVRLGGSLRLYRYILAVQPVPARPLLPARRGRSVIVHLVEPGDPALSAMPLTPEVLAYRFRQGAVCLGAFRDAEMIGCLWLCLGPYNEDEVRCRFVPLPVGSASWDFDVYVAPAYRTGMVFALLWDAANAYLRERGIHWSFSRTSAYNLTSLASHRRLGARMLGSATYLCAGSWQLMVCTRGPWLHLSTGGYSVPQISLRAPAREYPAGC